MNKIFSLLSILAISFTLITSCKKTSCEISGKLPAAVAEKTPIYIYEVGGEENPIDSIILKKGEKEYKYNYDIKKSSLGKTPSEKRLLRMVIFSPRQERGKNIYIVPEEGQIRIDSVYIAYGTPMNEELKNYIHQVDEIFQLKEDEGRVQLFKVSKDFIQKHPDKAVSLLAFQYASYAVTDVKEMTPIMDIVGEHFPDTKVYKEYKKNYDSLIKTCPGEMFTDFEGISYTKEGKAENVKLSDFVGKGQYVLIDFWASWCGPCRKEIKDYLKPVYEEFRKKGLSVIGVSVNDKLEDHTAAVKNLDIPWTQIFDEKSISADMYGITAIPQIILVGPDGIIIARNLFGDDIRKAVAPYFK